MARGFGATLGVSGTDRLVSALTPVSGARTICIVAYRNGPGGGNFGRIWDNRAGAGDAMHALYFSNSDNKLYIQRRMGSADALWTVDAPSSGAWHAIGVSLDASSSSNDPIVYIDGSSVTVTEVTAPTGAGITSTNVYWLGNRPSDIARVWDGHLAEFAAWNSILSAGDHADFASGVDPSTIDAGNLVYYVPLVSDLVATVGTDLTATGTAVTTHPAGFSDSDTTAPVLSSPTGTATGSTTATIGATTDEGNGTLYGYVSTSATPPSGTDLKAGTGAVWSGSASVSSTGAKTLSATGLTASTAYYAHLLHTDAATNDSNIVTSAQFTTSAAGVITIPSVRAFKPAILNH